MRAPRQSPSQASLFKSSAMPLPRPPRLSLSLALPLLALLLLVLPAAASPDAKDDVHNRMNELVDSVKEAVHDADAAVDKRQVVDLGQSLQLLETKFSGLRAALAHELGASSAGIAGHADVSRQLSEKSTELVQSIIAQREELRKLSGDIRETESAIRALREGLETFDREMAGLHHTSTDLHNAHGELQAMHDDAKNRIQFLASRPIASSSNKLLFAIVFIEIAAIVVYVVVKRPGRTTAHKMYGKFG